MEDGDLEEKDIPPAKDILFHSYITPSERARQKVGPADIKMPLTALERASFLGTPGEDF